MCYGCLVCVVCQVPQSRSAFHCSGYLDHPDRRRSRRSAACAAALSAFDDIGLLTAWDSSLVSLDFVASGSGWLMLRLMAQALLLPLTTAARPDLGGVVALLPAALADAAEGTLRADQATFRGFDLADSDIPSSAPSASY